MVSFCVWIWLTGELITQVRVFPANESLYLFCFALYEDQPFHRIFFSILFLSDLRVSFQPMAETGMGLINKINSYGIAWRELKARMGIVDRNPERLAATIQTCMKHLLLLLVLAILSGHKSICQERGHKPSFSIVADTNIGKQLLNQCSRDVPKNIDSFWTPADSDIKQLENNFKKIYSVRATVCCWPGARVDSLKKYGFQYLGVIIRGQRYIYINAFPLGNETWYEEHKKDLSKNALIVCDGGTSFWGVLFDTKRRTFSLLAFNGDA